MSTTIRGIDIHTYLVKDPARAKAFYRDKLGLKMTWDNEQGAEFELPDGQYFGIWKMDDGSWTASRGIMFQVDDVKAACADLAAKGVKILGEPERSPVCTMGFGEDSEGNNFILHKRHND